VTDLAWTSDDRQLIYCAAGQAYRLAIPGGEDSGGKGIAPEDSEGEAMPFGAEFVACHPYLPICLCFGSWLKRSAEGRLFLVNLNTLELFDENGAEGIIDLRWNDDGTKAYAVTADGTGYIYEPELL
jgi:hypothetical protein